MGSFEDDDPPPGDGDAGRRRAAPGEVSARLAAVARAAEHQARTGSAATVAHRGKQTARAARQARLRTMPTELADLIHAISGTPDAAERLATLLTERLERAGGPQVELLHGWAASTAGAVVDHLAVTPTGVLLVEASRARGRPTLERRRRLIRRAPTALLVGSHDRTDLVAGLRETTRAALERLAAHGLEQVPVRAVLCLVVADWPLGRDELTLPGVAVTSPRRVAELLGRPGPLGAEDRARVRDALLDGVRARDA